MRGPLHAARLARELEIPRVLVPRNPGILCALGLLLSDLKTNYAQTHLMPLVPEAIVWIIETFDALALRASAWFDREGLPLSARTLTRTVDMRYAGQNYELPVALPSGAAGSAVLDELRAGFERAREQMYGYIAAEEPIQIVTFRLEAVGRVPRAEIRAHPPAVGDASLAIVGARDVWLAERGALVNCPVYDREKLAPGHRVTGPAIVEQMDATTVLLPDQTATVDVYLNLTVEV